MTAFQHTSPAAQAHNKRQAIGMVVQGRSVTSVSAELGVPATTLISWLRSSGVSLVGRPRPDVKVSHEARARAMEQVLGGLNAALVAEELGITTARVYQWLRAAGVKKPRHVSKSNATRYTPEFKRDAVRQVVELGRKVQTVSVEADISHQTLRDWIKAASSV